MPDDISGFEREFQERLMEMSADWAKDLEDDLGPTQDDVAEMMEIQRKRKIQESNCSCDGSGILVWLGVEQVPCGCPASKNDGLKGCVHCGGTGYVGSKMSRHGWSYKQCLCVPEYRPGGWKFWGPRSKRVDPRACYGRDCPRGGFVLDTWEDQEFFQCDPGLCMTCLSRNFPDGMCRCLEEIGWFWKEQDERPVDPHGAFWR